MTFDYCVDWCTWVCTGNKCYLSEIFIYWCWERWSNQLSGLCVCVDWATAVRNDVSLAVQVSGAGFQTAVCASTQQHSLCMVQRCCQCADSASFTLQVHFKIILDVMATTRSSIAECSEKMHILVVHRKDAYTRCSRHYTWSNFSCSRPSMFQWHSCTFGRGTVGSVPMMGSR